MRDCERGGGSSSSSSAAAAAIEEMYLQLTGSALEVIEGFVIAPSTNGFLIKTKAAACTWQQVVAIGAVTPRGVQTAYVSLSGSETAGFLRVAVRGVAVISEDGRGRSSGSVEQMIAWGG